jgi:hypothetical protein
MASQFLISRAKFLPLLLLVACDQGASGREQPVPTPEEIVIPGEKQAIGPADPAFAPSTDAVLLLPFRVRLNKLSAVAGVPTDHASFSELNRLRLELGDYDYGKGVAPDLTWSAKRMTTWIQAVMPICDSAEFKARYPSFPAALTAFIPRAHGRPATDADRELVSQVLQETSFDGAKQQRTLCLALLSSAEFVAQ